MLSVNTNYSAMVALQNLNFTNNELEGVQNKISTGLKISSARDNGAIYAIAEGQRSRVSSVAAVKDGIDRANSTIDVALAAGKSIGEILQKLKSKAVAAQADDLTADQRDALQADFASMRAQIDTIANSAQFNGANLASGNFNLNVLISDLGGSVAATTDGVQSVALASPLSGSALVIAPAAGDLADGDLISFDLTDSTNLSTFSIEVELTPNMTIDQYVEAVNASSGGKISASYDDVLGQFTYLINDTNFDDLVIGTSGVDASTLGAGVATAVVSSAGTNTMVVNGTDLTLGSAMFSTFATLDISTSAASATTASNALEQAITDLNVTLASLGSQATALDAQQDFLTKLSDEIENGIGNLVDADLAKESAKLQSLQIKQQLGAQALSIANQAPQVILSLFQG
ncbi:MAG TPA: flagellin [Hyphomonadaceae bacterium]|nr:flagellin [Hyphomonadaceae bacterium]HPI48303.1 flagellin [Hyphomonadaceae bacterium]